jgi:hypothetical protein
MFSHFLKVFYTGRCYSIVPVLNSTDNHGRLETKKKTVMICDDEPDVLQVFALILKSM